MGHCCRTLIMRDSYTVKEISIQVIGWAQDYCVFRSEYDMLCPS